MTCTHRPTTLILLALLMLLSCLTPLSAAAGTGAYEARIAQVDANGYSFGDWHDRTGVPQEYRLLNWAIELIRKRVTKAAAPAPLLALNPARVSTRWQFSLSPNKIRIGLQYRF